MSTGRRISHNVDNRQLTAWMRTTDSTTDMAEHTDQIAGNKFKRRRSSINMLLRSGLGESALKEDTTAPGVPTEETDNKENININLKKYCNKCRNDRMIDGQGSSKATQLHVSRELFQAHPLNQHINRNAGLNTPLNRQPPEESDLSTSTLSPPTRQSYCLDREGGTRKMHTVVRARFTPTITTHINMVSMTHAEEQEKKEKMLTFVQKQTRKERDKSEQGKENDSPLSKRIQALIRMRYHIRNALYLAKRHASPRHLLAIQQELLNLRDAIGTGVTQVNKWLKLQQDTNTREEDSDVTGLIEVTETLLREEWLELKEVGQSNPLYLLPYYRHADIFFSCPILNINMQNLIYKIPKNNTNYFYILILKTQIICIKLLLEYTTL